MEEYIQAFNNHLPCLPDNCDLTGLYGRITHGANEDDFVYLQDPRKRLSWVFDHEALVSFLRMSHLEMLIHCGHTAEWIRHRLGANRKFKLIVCSIPSDEVKLATWENIFQILTKAYPEIDSHLWSRYLNQFQQMTFKEIDPEGTITKNIYPVPAPEAVMHLQRFLTLKDPPTLLQVRTFLHHQIGLNELFQGNGRTMTHDGVLSDKEYLTINRPLNQLRELALLDLNPILP